MRDRDQKLLFEAYKGIYEDTQPGEAVGPNPVTREDILNAPGWEALFTADQQQQLLQNKEVVDDLYDKAEADPNSKEGQAVNEIQKIEDMLDAPYTQQINAVTVINNIKQTTINIQKILTVNNYTTTNNNTTNNYNTTNNNNTVNNYTTTQLKTPSTPKAPPVTPNTTSKIAPSTPKAPPATPKINKPAETSTDPVKTSTAVFNYFMGLLQTPNTFKPGTNGEFLASYAKQYTKPKSTSKPYASAEWNSPGYMSDLQKTSTGGIETVRRMGK